MIFNNDIIREQDHTLGSAFTVTLTIFRANERKKSQKEDYFLEPVKVNLAIFWEKQFFSYNGKHKILDVRLVTSGLTFPFYFDQA